MLFGNDQFEEFFGQLEMARAASGAVPDPHDKAKMDEARAALAAEQVVSCVVCVCFSCMFSCVRACFIGGYTCHAHTHIVTATSTTRLHSNTPPKKQKRVEELIPKYERMLAPYVAGQQEQFRTWCRTEASRLVQVQFGEPIVHTLGYLYLRKGEAEAGKSKLLGIPTVVEKIREVGHGVKSKLQATGGLVDIMTIQRDVQQQLEAGMPPEQAAATMQSKAGVFIDGLFKIKYVFC